MNRSISILTAFLLAISWQLFSLAATGQQSPAVVAPRSTSQLVPSITLPLTPGSARLMVFGDSGRGSKDQYELANIMLNYRQAFPYNTVLMTGDNIYGSDSAEDMKRKFADVYRAVISQGVMFYASLGNHDSPNQRFYPLFNMSGKEHYRIEKGNASIYALNSNNLDKAQLDWLVSNLSTDSNKWKIAFFHHPPFSSGDRHGSDLRVRNIVHPLFVKYGVDVVFTGHDHFYERIVPQDGISYFVTGAGGKIRKGDIKERSPLTAAGFDTDLSFMLVEFTDDEMHFQVISREGKTIDSGITKRRD